MAKKDVHGFSAGNHAAAVNKAVAHGNAILPAKARAADVAEDKRDHGRDESREKY